MSCSLQEVRCLACRCLAAVGNSSHIPTGIHSSLPSLIQMFNTPCDGIDIGTGQYVVDSYMAISQGHDSLKVIKWYAPLHVPQAEHSTSPLH
jgi:hypothetical protein